MITRDGMVEVFEEAAGMESMGVEAFEIRVYLSNGTTQIIGIGSEKFYKDQELQMLAEMPKERMGNA